MVFTTWSNWRRSAMGGLGVLFHEFWIPIEEELD
jgi:hypothetical protein